MSATTPAISTSSTWWTITALGISFTVVAIGSGYVYHKRRSEKWPPLTKEYIYETSMIAIDGNLPTLMLENARSIGPIYRLAFMTWRPVTCICDPSLARKLLEIDSNKSHGYRKFREITFNHPNIISKDTFNDGWDWARKGVAPSFSNTNLYKSLPKLQLRLNEFVEVLDSLALSETKFDLSEALLKFTFNFIATSMFGVDYKVDISSNSQSEASQFLHELHVMIVLAFKFKAFRIDRFWNGEIARGALASKRLREFSQKILDNYRNTYSSEELQQDTSILAHLIRSPYESDEARCADMIVFLIGGHDTTAYTLAWTFVELARHPYVVELIREELDRIIPGPAEEFTVAHLGQLEYLVAVIRESMRLWPVAATGSARRYTHDLEVGKYVIPKDTSVVFPFFAIFRSGIKEPDKFDPSRWLREDEDTEILKEIYFPFSTGRRNCVGQNLAMLELKLVLATLIRRYDFKLHSEVTPKCFMTMKPDNSFFTVSRRRIHKVNLSC